MYTIETQCLLVYSKQNFAADISKQSINGAIVKGPTNLVINPINPVKPRIISKAAAAKRAP